MGTKPQTVAYALTNSPAGLAAWIIEKFHRWSDCGGDLDRHFSRDVLLTNIMIYWLTGAIGSTFWPYYARLHEPWIVPDGESVMVPTAYAEQSQGDSHAAAITGGALLRQHSALDAYAGRRPFSGARVSGGAGDRYPRFFSESDALKHDPEKWNPAFRKDHAQTKS